MKKFATFFFLYIAVSNTVDNAPIPFSTADLNTDIVCSYAPVLSNPTLMTNVSLNMSCPISDQNSLLSSSTCNNINCSVKVTLTKSAFNTLANSSSGEETSTNITCLYPRLLLNTSSVINVTVNMSCPISDQNFFKSLSTCGGNPNNRCPLKVKLQKNCSNASKDPSSDKQMSAMNDSAVVNADITCSYVLFSSNLSSTINIPAEMFSPVHSQNVSNHEVICPERLNLTPQSNAFRYGKVSITAILTKINSSSINRVHNKNAGGTNTSSATDSLPSKSIPVATSESGKSSVIGAGFRVANNLSKLFGPKKKLSEPTDGTGTRSANKSMADSPTRSYFVPSLNMVLALCSVLWLLILMTCVRHVYSICCGVCTIEEKAGLGYDILDNKPFYSEKTD